MSNSKNVSLFDQLNSSKKRFLIDKNLSYNNKRTCELFNNNIKEPSYAKMIIESYDTLSKSQAIKFLQQALSTESKLSLLDAMKDKVTLSSEEIGELVPSSDSSSCSFDNLSYLSLFIPQEQSPHIFTSFNNAAQSTRTSSNGNKRSSLLHGLFGRHSSKKRASLVKQPLKISQQTNKKRIISVGDQVKLSSTKVSHVEQPHQSKNHYDINIQGDTIDNRKTTNNKVQLSFQGLRYDFKQIKDTSAIKASEIKLPSKDNLISIPFASHSSFIQDKSLASLSPPTSVRQHINEQKQYIQSAHSVGGIPRIKTTNTTLEKISFNADQYKYHTQTPNYHYPKRLSAIEILAKQYSPSVTPQNSTGLFWYNAHQQTMDRTISFSKHVNIYKGNNRFDSSSDSRDTSSSSNSSSSNNSTKTKTNNNSSSSSSTSSSQKTSKSSSNSTVSSSQSKQQTIKATGQYNRNQNDKDDVIRIDLNSSMSQTSTSTNSTSMQPCHQRSISRKQLSTISNTTTTSDNDSSSSASSTSSLTIATNDNNNKAINSVEKLANNVTFNIPLVSDLFSSVNNRTIGKFKVKRQRIEPNIIT